MASNKTRFLAIDDKPDNLITLQALIMEAFADATLFTASSGQEGLEIAAKVDPDVILLDIVMPQMDGYEVCRRLKADQKLRDIPVVFITATKGDKRSRITALECGAEAFLDKPIDRSELIAQIRAMEKIRVANVEKRDEKERLDRLVQEQTEELVKAYRETIELYEAVKRENENRKKSESALLEAQRVAHIGSFEYDVESDTLACTDEGLAICGVEREAFNGAADAILRLIHPADREAVDKANAKAMAEKKGAQYTCRMIRTDGEARIVNVRLLPVFDENGIHIKNIGTVQDVTEHRAMEEAIRASEEEYKYIFDNSVVGKSITFVSGEIRVNNAFCKMLGYTKEELASDRWQDITHPDDVERSRLELEPLFLGEKKEVRFEKRYIKKDGSVVWAQVQTNVRRDADGEPLYFMTSVTDISSQKRSEEALKESELRFRTLVENELAGVFIIQGQKHIYVNPAYCAIGGYTAEEIYKANIYDNIHPDDLKLVKTNVNKKLDKENERTHYTFRRRHKNGDYRMVESMSVGIIINNQPAIVGNIIDITERMRIENELIESEKRFRTLSENALIGVCIIDEDGKRRYSNKVYNEIMDYSPQEATDYDIFAGIHPDDLEKVRESVRDKLSGKVETTRNEYRRKHKNGEYRTIETYDKKAFIDGCPAIINCVIDVTERKLAEDKLRESEEKFAKAFHTAPYSITITRLEDGKILDVNEAFVSISGYTREEALTSSSIALKLWADPKDSNRVLEGIEQGKSVYNKEYLFRKKNGEIITGLFSNQLIHLGSEPAVLSSVLDITDRKRAEEALRREQNLAKMYLETANVMFIAIDRNGTVTLINNKGCEILGREQGVIVGKNWIENFIPQAARADIEEVFGKIVSGEVDAVEYHENPVVNAAGEEKLISWHNTTLHDDVGNITGLFSAGIDITEHKQAEDKLKESEERHSLLISQMTSGLALHEIILDDAGKPIDYRFLDVNKSFERLTGLLGKNIIGKTVLEVMPGTERYWIEEYGHVALTGKPLHYENYSRELGKYYEVSAYQPQYKQFAVIITDVTKQRAAVETLKQSEAKFRTYTEMAPVGIFVTDEQGRYLEVNKAACDMTGYTEQELLGISIPEFLAPESLDRGIALFQELLKSGHAKGELKGRTKGGETYWIDLFSVRISNNRYMAFCMDISDRKRDEERILYLIDHDHLTGIYNRRYFEQALAKLDVVQNLPIAIVMGDVNGLKLVNDSFGHAAGDEILKKASEIIQKACRHGDIVARTGGDEFVLLLPKTDEAETMEIIKRIKDMAMNEMTGSVTLSISLGYRSKSDMEENIQEVLVEAENDMYRHKIYESSSMRNKTIDVVMHTLFEKSSREMMHSRRVSVICEAIATQMHFDKDHIEQMRLAGLLHDIGKIGVEESILNKTQKLNKKEWEEMRKHPEAGWRILNAASEFSELANFVLEHHERWDGKGYPNGLKGEGISLGARIIAVADAYDAMTSGRTYRNKLSIEDAIRETKRCIGTQFDPTIAKIFIEQVLEKIQ